MSVVANVLGARDFGIFPLGDQKFLRVPPMTALVPIVTSLIAHSVSLLLTLLLMRALVCCCV